MIGAIAGEIAPWQNTVVFVSWDDWGRFYDHVSSPTVDNGAGHGIRVPRLTVSSWAKHGYLDDQILSHDSYLKFIEDVFLGGQRIDSTDGRADSRDLPGEREHFDLGDLVQEFDFNAVPAKPPLLVPRVPFNTFAYVPNKGSQDISAYQINQKTGRPNFDWHVLSRCRVSFLLGS